MYGDIVKYEHHGMTMAVKEGLKGTHREHCLCFECGRFKPSQTGNCPLAERLFELDQAHGMVTPVFECSQHMDGQADLSAMQDPA